jgi:hypothetical protein
MVFNPRLYFVSRAHRACSFVVGASKQEIGNKASASAGEKGHGASRHILRKPPCLSRASFRPARPRCDRRFSPLPASSHCSGRCHTILAQDVARTTSCRGLDLYLAISYVFQSIHDLQASKFIDILGKGCMPITLHLRDVSYGILLTGRCGEKWSLHVPKIMDD